MNAVNDHRIQDMGVRKCIYLYHFMYLINITRRVPFSVFLLQKSA